MNPDGSDLESRKPVNCCEVCEKAVLKELTPYLTTNKRLAVEQSGNKKWHSTETSLTASTDTILEAVDKKELTAKLSIWI